MNKETIIESIKYQMLKYLPKDWKEVTLFYIKEKRLSNYGLDYISTNNDIESVCPSIYSLNTTETNRLNEYLVSINNEEKYNKLKITLYPNESYNLEHLFDKQANEHSIKMDEYYKEKEKNKIELTKKISPKDYSRFIISNNSSVNEKIFDIPLTNAQLISNLFTRLYSLFDKTPIIISEGFYQEIKDIKTDTEFVLMLNQFGIGYYSENKVPLLQESISTFHSILFSELLVFKKCELTYNTDFGDVHIGFDGKNLFYKEENDDNRT